MPVEWCLGALSLFVEFTQIGLDNGVPPPAVIQQ
jgi:hypothetical protein